MNRNILVKKSLDGAGGRSVPKYTRAWPTLVCLIDIWSTISRLETDIFFL